MSEKVKNQIKRISERLDDPREKEAFVNTMGFLAAVEDRERLEREAALLNNASAEEEEEEISHDE